MKFSVSFYCFLFISIFSFNHIFAQSAIRVTGTVIDSETGVPLSGANILVEEAKIGAASDADGSFTIRNIPQGNYTLSASYVGYDVRKERIILNDRALNIKFILTPKITETSEVIVTSTRARKRETPIAFSNLSKEDIQQRYRAQDVPFFLTELPGINAYSTNGNGIGYSYITVRGFNQSRVAVLINGIPQNDPETHDVYWIDLPDILASVEDVQVQRGVGSSLYGGYGIGGTINLETNNFTHNREIDIKSSVGSFNTRKFTLSFNSGLIDNSWAMNTRFSRILSDGYRDQSWVDLWSYYISAVRYGVSTTTRVNLYGGPEKTHFAFFGATQAELQQNRKFNPSVFKDDTDDFNQPHYEIIHDWDINENTRLSNTVFYIKGDGHFLFRAPRPFDPTFEDVVQKDLLDIKQYGWLPRFELEHKDGTFMIGGEARYNWTRHWKEIQTSFQAPTNFSDNSYDVPYDYIGKKWMYTLYAHELYNLTPRLTAMVGLQFMYHRYDVGEDKVRNVAFDVDYSFLTPRLGLNYNATDNLNVFGNYSQARREPSMRDLWDPSGVFNFPTATPFAFNTIDEAKGIWKDPFIVPEELSDWELGVGYQRPGLQASVNGYIMDFENEIVNSGYIGVSGEAIRSNAARTMHRGLEMSLRYAPVTMIDFSSNVTISENFFKSGSLFDFTNQPVNVQDKTIANFPEFMSNNRITVRHDDASVSFYVRHVGKQYLDNTQNENRIIDPYTVSSLSLAYGLRNIGELQKIELLLDFYNLFDTEYETYGHIDFFGNPAWIPGAERHFLFTIRGVL